MKGEKRSYTRNLYRAWCYYRMARNPRYLPLAKEFEHELLRAYFKKTPIFLYRLIEAVRPPKGCAEALWLAWLECDLPVTKAKLRGAVEKEPQRKRGPKPRTDAEIQLRKAAGSRKYDRWTIIKALRHDFFKDLPDG